MIASTEESALIELIGRINTYTEDYKKDNGAPHRIILVPKLSNLSAIMGRFDNLEEGRMSEDVEIQELREVPAEVHEEIMRGTRTMKLPLILCRRGLFGGGGYKNLAFYELAASSGTRAYVS